jgi:hypothetical protein
MLPFLLLSQLCQNMNFANFGQLGTCFIETMLFGDIGLAGLMILSVFVGFIVRYNMPGQLILPLATALTYILFIATGGASIFFFFFILTLIVNGVLVVLGIMNYINR